MKKVGDKRKFEFNEEWYEIAEIIENPNISMKWTWASTMCPHCKKKIGRVTNHVFTNIEILTKCEIIDEEKDEMDETNWKKIDDIKAEDINIMGFTRGKKYMQIPIDKKAYNLALSASQKFKRFIV